MQKSNCLSSSLYQLELVQVEEEEEPKEGEESKPEVINMVFPIVGIALFFLSMNLMYYCIFCPGREEKED